MAAKVLLPGGGIIGRRRVPAVLDAAVAVLDGAIAVLDGAVAVLDGAVAAGHAALDSSVAAGHAALDAAIAILDCAIAVLDGAVAVFDAAVRSVARAAARLSKGTCAVGHDGNPGLLPLPGASSCAKNGCEHTVK